MVRAISGSESGPLRLWDQLGWLVSDDFVIGIVSLVIAAL
jgi:hypothetical protein